ncbi:MAG: flagellar basal body rod protein FlgB [Clostridiales bacterium]|nr:MAG: flagellar basal body rod protein FlgB [Clostridiales bacterium]
MLNRDFNSIDMQRRALDASWLRQRVLSNNIANVDTPGYKRQDVDFESMLRDYMTTRKVQMTTTDPRHIGVAANAALQAHVTTDKSTSMRLDGNNVNIDVEMAAVAQNAIKYNAVTAQINGQIKRLKAAIRGDV